MQPTSVRQNESEEPPSLGRTPADLSVSAGASASPVAGLRRKREMSVVLPSHHPKAHAPREENS